MKQGGGKATEIATNTEIHHSR